MQQHGSKYFARRSLPNYPTPTLGIESLGQSSFFQNMVMLHIKLKIESQMQQHGSKYFARSHPRPWGWGQ